MNLLNNLIFSGFVQARSKRQSKTEQLSHVNKIEEEMNRVFFCTFHNEFQF